MRLILLGNSGQLGWELQRTLSPLGELLSVDYPEIDLIQPESACKMIQAWHPDLVLNATAYTILENAEKDAETALAINTKAPGMLAEAAQRIGAAFIHYSTDYVFDGTKGSPYNESDHPNPLNVYGRTKLAGEQAVAAAQKAYLVFRTSWVYSLRRDNFVTKVLGWARQNKELFIVDDQIGSPTWARMLAEISAQLLAKSGAHPFDWIAERSGVYHLAGDGAATRLEWATETLRLDPHPEEHLCSQARPAQTSDFPSHAVRPLYSALDCSRFISVFGLRLPPWRTALQMAMSSDERLAAWRH
jgi:dTDP-4-dehydrorhamnose reductase